MAPEVIAAGDALSEDDLVAGQKGDIWSLGICILETYLVELAFLHWLMICLNFHMAQGCHIWPELSVKQNVRELIRRIMTLAAATDGVYIHCILALGHLKYAS